MEARRHLLLLFGRRSFGRPFLPLLIQELGFIIIIIDQVYLIIIINLDHYLDHCYLNF